MVSLLAFSQKPYFIYLQTDDNAPFFVQLNKKNYSSSSVGHLILSGLPNGTYPIQLGFPGQHSMQDYQLVVENKDQGYLVKKMGEPQGYAIVNLQTEAVQYSGAVKKAGEEAEKQKAFALAEAKRIEEEKAVAEAKRIADENAAAEAKKLEAEKAAAVALPATQNKEVEKAETESTQTSQEKKDEKAAQKSTVDHKSGVEGGAVVAGVATVATVAIANGQANGEKPKQDEAPKADSSKAISPATGNEVAGAETPVAKPATAATAGTLTAAEIAALQEEARRIDSQGKRDSALAAEKARTANTNTAPVFLDLDITMPGDSAADNIPDSASARLASLAASANLDIKDSVAATSAKIVPVGDSLVLVRDTTAPQGRSDTSAFASVSNPNCKAAATDADLELVSMIIQGEKDPEDALEILKKTVKVKCITTLQLRKLTLLFTADEHRYALLDLAYRYTSDRNNYAPLADLLTDTYYINRFKAMLQ